jgi:uncharacterized protein (TIGR02284 family)
MQMTQQADTAVKLNDLLRGELSAIESYNQAIKHLNQLNMMPILEEAHNCHVERANTLSKKVRDLGGQPVESSGVWGALAKILESGAHLFGDKATITVLEEGEDHGLEQYTTLCSDSNLEVRSIVRQFLPKQELTHSIMRDLKRSFA